MPANTDAPAGHTTSAELIGRDHELALLVSALRNAPGELVTLIGPGGVGKSRLARAVADRLEPSTTVWFVPLAPLTSIDRVPFAIAAAGGAHIATDDLAWAVLHRQLGAEPITLVLDNLEHLPDLAPHLADLLVAAPQTTILATSRRAAGIRGERVIELAPLATASDSDATHPFSDAARLFLAVGNQTSQALSSMADRDAIEAICRHLDGLPLAIELVASRLRLLSPQSILETVAHHRQSLLTLGNGHGQHHQTLQHTIGRSYHAVGAESRILLHTIAMAPAGMPHAMAKSVLGHDPTNALVDLTAHHLALLTRQDGDDDRYTALDTIRTFARAQTAPDIDPSAIRLQMLAYFTGETSMIAPTRSSADEPEAMRRLEDELPTILLLLDTSLASANDEEIAASAQLLIGLRPVIEAVGPLGQTAAWLDQLIFLLPETHPLLPTVVYTAGRIALFQGRLDTASRHIGWARAQSSDDPELTALATHALGLVANGERRYVDALAAFATAANLFAVLDQQTGILRAENAQGLAYIAMGAFPAARSSLDRALIRARATGNTGDEAMVLGNLAYLEQQSGSPQNAVRPLESVIEIASTMGYRLVQATANANLAQVWMELGDGVAAREYAGVALDLFRRFGGLRNEADIYDGLARLAWRDGTMDEELQHRTDALMLQQLVGSAGDQARTLIHLVRLWWMMGNETRAASSLRQAIRLLPDPSWPEGASVVMLFEAIDLARAGRPDDRTLVHAALERLARQTSAEIAAEWAQVTKNILGSPRTEPPEHVREILARLSAREREVLPLIVAGRSDREIAVDLAISPRTAGFHVSNILHKLDVTTRIEAAAWAARYHIE